MGTRNLTCVVHDGKFKVAQYGQWDGYPSGQGATILAFLSYGFDRDQFIAQLNRCTWITKKEFEELLIAATGKSDGWMTCDQADKFKELAPQLSRDTGAGILEIIAKHTGRKKLRLHNDVKFGKDSLFCEWAYSVDLDDNRFMVFPGGFAVDKNGCVTTKPRRSYPLDKLPIEEQFLSHFKREDD
jgi:hypothetical protein